MSAWQVHARRGLAMVAGNFGNFAFILVRSKLLAVYLGPIGVGWIALVNNLVELTANLTGLGVSDALSRELARKQALFTHQQVISTGLAITVLSFVVVLPFTEWLFLGLAAPAGHVVSGAIGFAVAAAAAAAYRFVSGIYLGQGRSRFLFNALVWGACFNLVATAVLLFTGQRSYLYFILLSYIPAALISYISVFKGGHGYFSAAAIRRMPAWRPIMAIVVPTVLGQPLETAIVFVLRSATAARLGDVALGQIQPGLQLVILSASLFNAFIGITVARWDQSAERGFSRGSLMLGAMAVIIPVVGAVVLVVAAPLWEVLVRLLFTSAFLPGVASVPWFLGGEALHLAALLLFSTFLSRKLAIYTLIPRLAGVTTMVVAMHNGMDRSLVQVGQAYACTFACYYGVTLVMWCTFQMKFVRDARMPPVIRL